MEYRIYEGKSIKEFGLQAEKMMGHLQAGESEKPVGGSVQVWKPQNQGSRWYGPQSEDKVPRGEGERLCFYLFIFHLAPQWTG